MRVFGVVGKIGAGKDTAIEAIPGAVRVGFSDALKDAARRVFRLTKWQTDTQEGKAEAFVVPVHMDNRLAVLSDILGIRLEPRGKVARSSRELLQFLGTDYVRSLYPDYWLDRWDQDVDQLSPDAIVFAPDTRFLNEAARIRKRNGKIIRVVRGVPGKPITVNMDDMGAGETGKAEVTLSLAHLSEVEQDQIFADYTLWNNATIAELQGNMRFIVRAFT